MFIRLTSLLFVALTFSIQLQAQKGTISGAVISEDGPLEFATVILKNQVDSSIVKAEITSEDGTFSITNLSYGTYFAEASYVGMISGLMADIELNKAELNLSPLLLKTNVQLNEVKVSAIKPLIEVMADKTVFNVENSLSSAGTNGFELLRKAPGVVIDNSDNIILDGKGGVQIHIDGKPSPLSGEDLTNFLRSIQSTDIEAIEIITQPSSKYDAAGNAGIINIKLKQDKRLGTNGTVSAGYAYGQNNRYNSSISLNKRTGKTNFFGTYSNNFGKNYSYIFLDRIQQNVRYDSKTETISDNAAHSARLGFDVFPGTKHTIGVLFDGSFYSRDSEGNTSTPITPLITGEIDQILIANNESQSDNYNLNGNVNYRFADTTGHEILIDLDYGAYDRDRTNYQPNSYLSGYDSSSVFERNYRMITPTVIDIYTAKIDYSQNLWGGKIGIGAKYSNVDTDNEFQFYDEVSGEDIFNEDRSNRFEYNEKISAAYINYSKNWKKWSTQLGIRAEQTISEGNLTSTQQLDDDNVQRNYLDWFPSGGLTFRQDQNNSWALSYSRRIQRPNYQSLNPFENQLDELSFSKGNPFLQPQYTNNVKLSHTFKYRLNTSVSYSYINDFFAKVTDTLGATKNFLQTRNIANQQVWNLGVSYPFDAAKWWSVYFSLNAYHSSYEGTDDRFVAIDQSTLSFYAQNTFSLPAGFKFEVSGWFSSPSIWGGTYLTKSLGSLDLAVQKKFLDDRLSARIAVNDVLFTSPWFADMEFGDLYINGTGGWESRQVRVNLSYAFGSQEVKGARKRKTGIEEEDNRVGE